MRKIIQLTLAILFSLNIYAQPQVNPKSSFYLYGYFCEEVLNNNNTFFQTSWGTTNGRNTSEGCAQLNDPATGNLIFSTDGRKIINPQGNIIPNGSGLLGTNSSTNAATLIPMNIDYGFLVTTSDTYVTPPAIANNFAYYSTYKLGLSNGSYNPSINSLKKNIKLLAPGIDQFGEKTVVIRKPNELGFYLIMHSAEGTNNKLVVFKNIGTDILYDNTFSVGTSIGIDNGQIRCTNIDGSGNCKIIAAYSLAHKVDVYNFNYNTGVISFDVTYSFAGGSVIPYGLEISTDNKTVYFTDYSTFGKLYSIDLLTGAIHSFLNPNTNIVSGNFTYGRFGQMQTLDNGSIYFPIQNRRFVASITNPNFFGVLNTYSLNTTNTFLLGSGGVMRFGLPNYNRL